MTEFQEGQTATNAKGQRIVFKGGQWVNAGTAPGSPLGGRPLAFPDKKVLNDLTTLAQSNAETVRQYEAARPVLERFRPGPLKGAFMDVATAQDNGNIWDKIGSAVVGGPARMLGVITPQMINDFQRLKGLGSERVLEGQIAQKGPQTEADAARLAATEISPYKSVDVNEAVIASGKAKAERTQRRAPFYTAWAQKYGLNAVDEKGRGVEQAFQESIKSVPAANAPVAAGGWKLKAVK